MFWISFEGSFLITYGWSTTIIFGDSICLFFKLESLFSTGISNKSNVSRKNEKSYAKKETKKLATKKSSKEKA